MARVDELFNFLQTPGLSDQQIAAEINRLGVTPSEVSQLTGVPVAEVQSRLAAVAPAPAPVVTAPPVAPRPVTPTPVAPTPVVQPPILQTPVAQPPILQTPVMQPTMAPTAAPTMPPTMAPPAGPTNLLQFQQFLQTPGLTDAQILAEMGRLGITNREVSGITGVPVTDVENRVSALAPTLPFANATQGMAQTFQNYTSIPIGAQFNPGVVGGAGSPYAQIMRQMTPVGNPYATARAGLPLGGYDPSVYDPNLLSNFVAQRAADTAAARSAADAAALETAAGNYGGYNGGLITKVMGPKPPTPDDGTMFVQKGEYIIKKDSVDKYGKGLLDMVNEGKIPAKKIKSLLD